MCTFQSCGTVVPITPFSIPFHFVSLYYHQDLHYSLQFFSKNQTISTINTYSHLSRHPNALFFEFLLPLFLSYGAEESSIQQSSATAWSAGLITLVNAGPAVKSSLRGEACVCNTRIKPCLFPSTARRTA